MFTLLRDLRRLRLRIDLPASRRARSLAIRHVDAGSCNGCEHELTLATSPYYDLQRYGLSVVASPRHADLLLVTGVVTTRMHDALLTAYRAMPEPRRVAALGDCALGCGVLGLPEEIAGRLEDVLPVDLRITGCPPDPQRIAEGLLGLLDGDGIVA
jgi:Ni,Fe-hydrogenase III small subunit